jgi:hypothetical protein
MNSQNKIKFITTIVAIFLAQLLFFVFANESRKADSFMSLTALVFLPITILLLFSRKKENIKTMYNLTSKSFYWTVIIVWTLLNAISFFTLIKLVNADILLGGGGMFSGLEYMIIPFLYEFEMLAIILLDFIWDFILHYTEKHSQSPKEQKIKIVKIIAAIALAVTAALLLFKILTQIF